MQCTGRLRGFEPRQSEPQSLVLPLHHSRHEMGAGALDEDSTGWIDRLRSRLRLRVLVQRSHHPRLRIELADVEEHAPRRDGAREVLTLVLDEALQEE